MQIHIWSLWSIDILLLFDIDLLIISLVIYCLGSSSVSFQQPFFWTLCFFFIRSCWDKLTFVCKPWLSQRNIALPPLRCRKYQDHEHTRHNKLGFSVIDKFRRCDVYTQSFLLSSMFFFFKHQMCDDGQSDCSHMTWVRYRSDTREHFTLH